MLTKKELQRFEERKQLLENILKRLQKKSPAALWFAPVPDDISAAKFEELKKMVWLRYTAGYIPDKFKINGGRKLNPKKINEIEEYSDSSQIVLLWRKQYCYEHLLFLRLESELKDLGNDQFVTKTITIDNNRGVHSAKTKLEKTELHRIKYLDFCRAVNPDVTQLEKKDTRDINKNFRKWLKSEFSKSLSDDTYPHTPETREKLRQIKDKYANNQVMITNAFYKWLIEKKVEKEYHRNTFSTWLNPEKMT